MKRLLITIPIWMAISGYLALSGKVDNDLAFKAGGLLILGDLLLSISMAVFPVFFYAVRNYRLLKECYETKLRRVICNGSKGTSILKKRIQAASEVKVMFVSANNSFLADHHEDLRKMIAGGGNLKIILASLNSRYLKDIEEIENRNNGNSISKEINASIHKVNEIVKEARDESDSEDCGRLTEYGHFSTQLRSSIILIDRNVCYLVPNSPPARTSESIGFLFEGDSLDKCSGTDKYFLHFSSVYEILKNNGKIFSAV